MLLCTQQPPLGLGGALDRVCSKSLSELVEYAQIIRYDQGTIVYVKEGDVCCTNCTSLSDISTLFSCPLAPAFLKPL